MCYWFSTITLMQFSLSSVNSATFNDLRAWKSELRMAQVLGREIKTCTNKTLRYQPINGK